LAAAAALARWFSTCPGDASEAESPYDADAAPTEDAKGKTGEPDIRELPILLPPPPPPVIRVVTPPRCQIGYMDQPAVIN
jgi:hypothetical protein